MKAIITTLIAVCIVLTNPSFAQWEWQSPIPQGNLLYKVQFVNSSLGWAVGEFGTLLHTSDGGLNWIGQEYGRTDNLLAIRMFSQFTGWAVGDNGTILHTTNGGDDWMEQISGTTDGLNALFFIDSLNGWVVGDKELILHTSNGGATWEFQQYPATQYTINAVAFLSATEGWAAGANRRVYHTTDGGTTWSVQVLGPSMTAHLNIYFADASLGFLVGTDGSIMRTTDGGAIWSQISTGDNVNYNQVIMQNTLVGWIAGDGGRILRTLNGGASWSTTTLSEGIDLNGITRYSGTGTLWMVGELGRILRSTNNGVLWSFLDSGSRLSVNWMDFSSATSGVAVGQTGLILRTTDGGSSWTQSISPTPSISMFGVDMINDNTGWAVGDAATILHTTDGVTWAPQTNPAAGKILLGTSFCDTENGWIAGGDYAMNTGIILHTANGGDNWTTQLNTSAILFGICFTDNLTGWAVGANGTILHTTDGGNNWTPQTSTATTALYWCSFINANYGWIVGDLGTILHTTNGGNLWTAQDAGGTFNLFSIAAEGILTATITGDSGTILRTTNSGTTWQKEYSRTAMDLFAVAHSTETWICGDYGTILKYDEPIVYGSVNGMIVNDLNNNGVPDIGEPGIAGWKVQITGPETLSTYSSIDGSFSFSGLATGAYTLTQEVLPAWAQTMPASPGGYSFTLSAFEPNFTGNFCNHAVFSVGFDIQSGWNILSCPVQLDDPRISSVYPTATSSAFLYGSGYFESDSVPKALGYWLKFPDAMIQWIAGAPVASDTIPVQAGWNIIGSVSGSTDTSAIISEPPEIIVSDYFGYNQSYLQAQSIQPGKGYWVKSSADGKIILNGGESAITKKSADVSGIHLNNITITDAQGRKSTLYFGSDPACPINANRYELPPLPPEDCFDVRFQNGGMLHLFSEGSKDGTLLSMQSVQYPINISWNIQPEDQTQYKIVNTAGGNKIVSELCGSGRVVLESAGPQALTLAASDISEPESVPTEYALMQNSPNPFNPATKLSFVISHSSLVKLRIFNVLGEEVSTPVNEVKQPGEYKINWNAEGLPSGIYYYRLEANSVDQPGRHFVSTKKMILLK